MLNPVETRTIIAPSCSVPAKMPIPETNWDSDAFRAPTYLRDEQSVLGSELSNKSPAELVAVIEAKGMPLPNRLAAGRLLALLGDPRIKPGQPPELLEIAGGTASIGINAEAVAEVVAQYSRFGVIAEWIAKEVPLHQVKIDPFRLARFPITNAEYLAYLLDVPNGEVPTSWAYGRYPLEHSNHPVFTVTEQAADDFCNWLSARTGRSFRLPSEFEWEWAAGRSKFEYPWGDSYNPLFANTAELGLQFTSPVGCFPEGASSFGLLDMAGNVEEYTSSTYEPYPGGDLVIDDLNPDEQTYRVARGGSFSRFADLCRVTRRHGRYHSDLYAMGFRIAEDI